MKCCWSYSDMCCKITEELLMSSTMTFPKHLRSMFTELAELEDWEIRVKLRHSLTTKATLVWLLVYSTFSGIVNRKFLIGLKRKRRRTRWVMLAFMVPDSEPETSERRTIINWIIRNQSRLMRDGTNSLLKTSEKWMLSETSDVFNCQNNFLDSVPETNRQYIVYVSVSKIYFYKGQSSGILQSSLKALTNFSIKHL